jgi:hypothetical protein
MAVRTQKLASPDDPRESVTESKMGSPFLDGSFARMMGWPVEVWLRCQAGLLKAAQPAASDWIERRRDAATSTLQTLEKLSCCSDLNQVAAVQRNWFEDMVRRFDSELQAIADQALAVSREALSATRYAAETSSEVASYAIQPLQRAAQEQQQRVETAAATAAAA